MVQKVEVLEKKVDGRCADRVHLIHERRQEALPHKHIAQQPRPSFVVTPCVAGSVVSTRPESTVGCSAKPALHRRRHKVGVWRHDLTNLVSQTVHTSDKRALSKRHKHLTANAAWVQANHRSVDVNVVAIARRIAVKLSAEDTWHHAAITSHTATAARATVKTTVVVVGVLLRMSTASARLRVRIQDAFHHVI